ncbi:hypothetical protein BCJMU39_5411 [Bacillus cereus]|nr:hypothetical protein BCM0079_5454 [Bacillus cereus]BCC44219.1 hypothetical protein BCJMU01_5386 [Bacillus cereus]BCC67888.1 hypothetical protein BCJMU39_5411 [Bacillus cereus]BCC96992.1 hypothetical protein BC30043_5421 [Bacillus cereus]BCD20657.1 hypothetical protein BC30077_5433 [Bacillus cereus]
MKLFLKGLSTLSTRAIYMIYVFFASILVVDYFSDTQKYNYTMIVTGVVFLCTIGFYVLRKSSLYIEKLNEKKCFLC